MQSIPLCSVTGCDRPTCNRGYCSAHYARWRRHGDVRASVPIGVPRTTAPAAQRFWACVDKDGPVPTGTPAQGPCWIWTGAQDGRGYGKFWNGTRHVKAYAYAYDSTSGPMREGCRHDHLCHVPLCVNPAHIVVRTHQENGQNRSAGPPSNNRTGVRGVHWAGWANKWRAKIDVGSTRIHVGYFDDLAAAELAVVSRRIDLHVANDLDRIRLKELTRPLVSS